MTTVYFDDLNLWRTDAADEQVGLDFDGYFFEIAGKDDGTELTNAEAIVSSITSDLFDGSSNEVTGWESASLTLRVQVVSTTPAGLASGSARLVATCRRPGIRPLSFALNDMAPTSVFDVQVATWKHEFDDLEGDGNGGLRYRRGYTMTLLCKPFARSQDAVSLPGLPVGGAYSETIVATGASTTGWSTTSRYITRRNLVLTPSYENSTSPAPWTAFTNSSAMTVITDAGAPDPTKVNRVTVKSLTAGVRSYIYSTVMTVVPGQAYPFGTRIKGGHAGMTTAGMRVIFFDGSGAVTSFQDITAALTTSAYATIASTLTAPTGAVQVRVYPFVQAGSSVPAGQFWYHDATAVIDLETVAATTFFDGDNAASGGLTYYWGSAQGTSGVSIETGLGVVTASGGAVFPRGSSSTVPVIHIPATDGVNLTYTGSINVASHRYIRIKSSDAITVAIDGVVPEYVASAAAGSFYYFYFKVPDSITTTASTVKILRAFSTDWAGYFLKVAEIATVSHPTSGTGRAITRAVTTVGSMPAEATIDVTNNGNALGDHLIVHSGSNIGGFTRLRAARTSGPAQTAAASSISGLTSVLATTSGSADTFQIPVNQMPEATYLLSAFLTGASLTNGTTYTFTYRASVIEDPSGTPVEHSVVTGTHGIVATGTTYAGKPTDLGLLNLPTTHIAVTGTSTAVVQIQLWVSAGTWTLDEAWLADVDNGQISVINLADAGLSGKVTSLEIVPAAIDRPQQQYLAYSGTAPNQTIREVIPTGWAAHRFDPADGDAQVNVINTATTPGLSVAIEFYPRWDVYAAPIVTESEEA